MQLETGGYTYTITFRMGTHHLLEWNTESDEDDYEVVTMGSYDKCKEYLDKIIKTNKEYDYNI